MVTPDKPTCKAEVCLVHSTPQLGMEKTVASHSTPSFILEGVLSGKTATRTDLAMANALSIASGIAGLITLSSSIVVAGYKYADSMSSAPDDLKSLLRETASLNSVLSQLLSHCMSDEPAKATAYYKLVQQNIFRECEQTLEDAQSLLRDCELASTQNGTNIVQTLLWPRKQKAIIKSRDCLNRLCASLHTAVTLKNTNTLRVLEHRQNQSNEFIMELVRDARDMEEKKILDWLSTLDGTVKHNAITILKHPGTYEWFLKEKSVLDWLDTGTLLWMHGASGVGKTVLV
jgi:hypothetical protein